jgi:alanyl-tRNA synthetase
LNAKGLKAKEWTTVVSSKVGGKCGGNDGAAQGAGDSAQDIDEALKLANEFAQKLLI